MPALASYRLSPTEAGLQDPAWSLSRYRGECRVVAASPEEARRCADGAFLLPLATATTAAQCRSPWQQPALVGVARLGAGGRRRGEVWCIPAVPARPGGDDDRPAA